MANPVKVKAVNTGPTAAT